MHLLTVLITLSFQLTHGYSALDESVIVFEARKSGLVFADGFNFTANNETRGVTLYGDMSIFGELRLSGAPVATEIMTTTLSNNVRDVWVALNATNERTGGVDVIKKNLSLIMDRVETVDRMFSNQMSTLTARLNATTNTITILNTKLRGVSTQANTTTDKVVQLSLDAVGLNAQLRGVAAQANTTTDKVVQLSLYALGLNAQLLGVAAQTNATTDKVVELTSDVINVDTRVHTIETRCVRRNIYPPYVYKEVTTWRPTQNARWNISSVLLAASVPRSAAWVTVYWRPTTVGPLMLFNALKADGSVVVTNYTLGTPVGTTQELGIKLGTPVAIPGSTSVLEYTYCDTATFTSYVAQTPRLLIVYDYCS